MLITTLISPIVRNKNLLSLILSSVLIANNFAQTPTKDSVETIEPYPFRKTPNINIPNLGEEGVYFISPAEEKKIRYGLLAELSTGIMDKSKVLDDEFAKAFVSKILNRLQENNDYINFILADDNFNASANIGGVVITYLGVWNRLSSVDAFAGVLAHEITHLKNRHISRMLSRVSKNQWLGLLAILAGVASANKNPNAAQALIYGGQALPLRGFLEYSREMEDEADRGAVGLLVRGGFDAKGLLESMQILNELFDAGNEDNVFLRTHPISAIRKQSAKTRIANISEQNVANEELQREYELIKFFIGDKTLAKENINNLILKYNKNLWREQLREVLQKKITGKKIDKQLITTLFERIKFDPKLSELELSTLIQNLIEDTDLQSETLVWAQKLFPQSQIFAKMEIKNWLNVNQGKVNRELAQKIIDKVEKTVGVYNQNFATYLAIAYKALSDGEINLNSLFADYYLSQSLLARGNVDLAMGTFGNLQNKITENNFKVPQFLQIQLDKLQEELAMGSGLENIKPVKSK